MANLSKLIETNHLTKQDGLWVLDRPTQFNYSDGEGSELFLKRIVSLSRDLSSQSLDLETSYPDWDWVAEYHLSYRRANLLRGLDLSQVENALEIGCGCGGITRYLGEQGICVDAIEGAQRRADIAQLRCRDLDNVRIINANYNDLQISEKSYDAIFAVGVIEYAGKFIYGFQSDEAAVITILKQLKRALTAKGVLVIAIENRNGLKYWLGATEDHFGQPYVGLSDYWGHSGTKTYTYNEWQSLLNQVGIEHWHFQFPFPDYKLPQVILDQTFIDNDENAYSLLYRIHSRDYLRPWQPGANEFSLWRAFHQSNQLKEYANSFLIFAGRDPSCLETLLPADFVYFSGGARKSEFRTMTLKMRQSDRVTKKYLWADESDSRKYRVQQSPNNPYFKGPLLATIWLEALLASDLGRFQMLLDRYFQYINQKIADDGENALIDALPANIVVDFEGRYRIIDQEWRNENTVTAGFILFRALLWFGHDNKDLLERFFQTKGFLCLVDFIEFGFHSLQIGLAPLLTEYIHREEAFQFEVSVQKNLRPIQHLLATRFAFVAQYSDSLKFFWAGENQSFSNVRCCEVIYHFENGRARIRCRFAFDRKVARVRIMPLSHASGAKLFLLEKITLSLQADRRMDSTVVWQVPLEGNICASAEYNHFVLPLSKPKGAFIASDKRAALDFPVTYSPKHDAAESGLFGLELELAGEAHLGDSFVAEHLTRKGSAIKQQFNRYRKISVGKNGSNSEKEVVIATEDDETRRLKVQLDETQQRMHRNEVGLKAVKSELKEARQFLGRLAKVKFIKSIGQIMPGRYGWLISDLNRYDRFNLIQSDYDLVRQSGLFDEAFYKEYQPELGLFNNDPLRHYLLFGGFNGLNPNRIFDTSFYLNQCPELMAGKLNPLVHYLSIGASEGHHPCYLFDSQYYLDQCSPTSGESFNPLQHYLKKGGNEGFDPHPAFDTTYYYSLRPDAKESSLTPLEHFFLFGELEQLSPTALFDTEYYLELRPNLRGASISAFRHFIEHGYKEGGSPSPFFNTDYYFHPDLRALKFRVNPISHYIKEGQGESRSPNPFFDPDYYLSQLSTSDKKNLKDPLSHYITWGETSELKPHPLFDTVFYKCRLAKTGSQPNGLLRHFYAIGFENSFMTHPLLEPGYCLAQLPYDGDKPDAKLLPFYAESTYGATKNPHPLFDAKFYRSQLTADVPGHINPLIHYVKTGCAQGLSTHPEFDPKYYIAQDLDPVLKEGQSPAIHYIYHGAQKERWPNRTIEQLTFKPRMSLVLLIDKPEFNFLSGRILAVMSQLYPRWRLSVIVRNPDGSDGYQYAKALAADDSRIDWIETDDKDSSATLLNLALERSADEYIVFVDEQMYLKAFALLVFVRQLNRNPDLILIHTDRNKNDPDAMPIEVPGSEFNSLSARIFIGPLACFKRSLINQMGGLGTWHQTVYNKHFLTHYLHQASSNSIAHVSEPLHYTMAKDSLSIVVRN